MSATNAFACQHTPHSVILRTDTDHRCEACRIPMKVGASYRRFNDPITQGVHDLTDHKR